MKFITKNMIIENIDVISRPIFHLDEIEQMYENTLKNLDKNLIIPKDVLASFKIKNDLNPEIWKGLKPLPEVKNTLIKIANDFYNELELPNDVKIKDILFVGSLANFNWSKFSDIDLHIVIDFSKLSEEPDQTKKRFDAEKNVWNDKHKVEIFGYPVEVYVQDVKEKLAASAIYSLKHNKWILMPEKIKFKVDKNLIKRKTQTLFDKLKKIKSDYDSQDFESVIKQTDILKKEIKKMRKSGLEEGGEFSIENLIFKILRRTDFMEILDTLKTNAYDKMVSINENQEYEQFL